MMQIENLSKSFGANKVLQNIHLQLEAGKVYGVVGQNGAGKTTLFRCMAGLESYFGRINTESDRFKDRLGFLPTNPFFFAKITGREYLQLLCNARRITSPDFDAKNIFELPLNEYAINYSTGMKKKLAVTGILLQQNDFFILDEPFNGVDIQSNILLTEIILRLKALKKTIVIASHIFSTLQDTCDEIHLLEAGKFQPAVLKADFQQLETTMKAITIGNRLDQLDLK
ncbi:MAG: ATP-binding cassette domain-containing protein [Saprospiraceae bacterium]